MNRSSALLPILLLSLPLAGAAQTRPGGDRSNEATTLRYLDRQASDLQASLRALESLNRTAELSELNAMAARSGPASPGLDDISPATRERLRESGARRISQELLAHGFTLNRIGGLKARGFDPVAAMFNAGPSPTLVQPAILAEQVVVAEWLDADISDDRADGRRSTVRFRVVETLKGDARPGQVYRVRFASGAAPGGGYSSVSTESELGPVPPGGDPGAGKRGRRFILLLSEALQGYRFALGGAKPPAAPEPYASPLAELIALSGDVTGGNHGYPGGEPLEAVRKSLAPLAKADRQVREIEAAIRRGGPAADGAMYALSHPVDLAEARRRMRLQNEIDRSIVARIRTREPTFAGVWIQHEPEYRVVVAFTRDPEGTLRRYTTDPLYEARLARKTQAQLDADQERVGVELNKLGVAFQGGTDITTGKLKFDILSDWDLVQAALRDGRLRLPEGAELTPPAPLKVAEPGPLPPGAPFMPRLKSRGGAQMAALAMGRLVVEDGCVRLRGSPEHSTLVVWSGEYALQSAGEPGAYRVVNLFTGQSIRIGEEVAMGGGGGDRPPEPSRLQAPIPPGCKGPYFFGGGTQSRASFEDEMLRRDARWQAERDRIPYVEALRRLREQHARGEVPPAPPAPPPPPRPQRR